MELVVVLGALVVALVGWVVLFVVEPGRMWPRTWAVALALVAYSVAALAGIGDLRDVVGDVGVREIGAGVVVGVAWLVATHVGYAVLRRVFPSFGDQLDDLYLLGGDDPPGTVLGPILAMALAEELLFRGVVQSQWGLVAGVVAYTAVQLVERKWALTLAALMGGTVWGVLCWWTDGLVAPFVAHAIWTGMLTLVWPLRADDVSPRAGAAPA
jgi:membrane protease YdiL (CAAX protease family)